MAVRTRVMGGRLPWVMCAALVIALALSTPADAAPSEPRLQHDRQTLDAAIECPSAFLANDRNPVLLVHGTLPSPRENFGWNVLPQLTADGYDVCVVVLSTRALGDIQIAAEYVVHALREIHDDTGRRVDVAGHSQGGLEPRWALAWWPSTRDLVGDVVTFASPHHGTVTTDGLCGASMCWPALHQMRPGSSFLRALHAEEDLSEVEVTSLGSITDELIQPPSTIELEDASNIILQDVCPARPVTHLTIVADAVAYALMVDTFSHDGPANPDRLPDDICLKGLVDGVGPGDVLAVDTVLDLLGGTVLDQEVRRSLLTHEEPQLAPYAAGHDQNFDPEREDGVGSREKHDEGADWDERGRHDTHESPSGGEQPSLGNSPTSSQGGRARLGPPLPATGSAVTTAGLGLLLILVLGRLRLVGEPTAD